MGDSSKIDIVHSSELKSLSTKGKSSKQLTLLLPIPWDPNVSLPQLDKQSQDATQKSQEIDVKRNLKSEMSSSRREL